MLIQYPINPNHGLLGRPHGAQATGFVVGELMLYVMVKKETLKQGFRT